MSRRQPRGPLRAPALVMSDVDGTLVTGEKALTARATQAALSLREHGVAFSIASSRPPFGLSSLVGSLSIDGPFAAFNGGFITNRRAESLRAHWIDPEVARAALSFFRARSLEVWAFTSRRWLCADPQGAYVAHERRTVSTDPTVADDFEDEIGRLGKIVAVSADFDRLAAVETEAQATFGERAQVARSQAYYLDVTHPRANKAQALTEIAGLVGAPLSACAAIGDGSNDVGMLETAGYAIAMGNAVPAVRQVADFVSTTNEEEGFAMAIEHILEAMT